MKRTASASWQGKINDGKGTLSTQSGVLKETSYSYRSLFDDGTETNPEELIAAAHAGCFTMALSAFPRNAGVTPRMTSTKAILSFEQGGREVDDHQRPLHQFSPMLMDGCRPITIGPLVEGAPQECCESVRHCFRNRGCGEDLNEGNTTIACQRALPLRLPEHMPPS